MNANNFFAKPPKAKRAFLAPYGHEKLRGRFGIRIELQPLLFSDPCQSPEPETELVLEHLGLSSIVPEELEHTRYKPKAERSPWKRYEGSWYFLGQHNWVDLNEIRFFAAKGPRIRVEYDLTVHLPIPPPNEYPLLLSVSTKTDPDKHKFVSRPPKHMASVGIFTETHQNFWECQTSYHGCPVTIQLHAERGSFRRISNFVKSVMVEDAITPTDIQKGIRDQIDSLRGKFDYFKIRTRFRPERFLPNWFSFYQDEDSDELMLSIRLQDPADTGQWFLRFRGTTVDHLEWIPNTSVARG